MAQVCNEVCNTLQRIWSINGSVLPLSNVVLTFDEWMARTLGASLKSDTLQADSAKQALQNADCQDCSFDGQLLMSCSQYPYVLHGVPEISDNQ
jgi:hypothetical protein